MADAEPYLLVAFPRTIREEIRVSINEYAGSTFVDVRLFADTGLPDRIPTKRGVTIPPEWLPTLLEALKGAQAECERRGLTG